MTRAADAYAALVIATEAVTPPCRDDDRYLTDHGPIPTDVTAKCAACSVLALCRTYALAERPKAGIWAGERWTEKRRPGRPRKDLRRAETKPTCTDTCTPGADDAPRERTPRPLASTIARTPQT